MMISPYRERRTRSHGVRAISGWQLKIYSICGGSGKVDETTLGAALRHAETHVQWPEHIAKYGFLTVHVGEEGVWLLVDLWVDDILRHFMFRAPVESPQQFGPAPDDGTLACVWELAVIVHERSSWIANVLTNPSQPDHDAYLRACLEIEPLAEIASNPEIA